MARVLCRAVFAMLAARGALGGGFDLHQLGSVAGKAVEKVADDPQKLLDAGSKAAEEAAKAAGDAASAAGAKDAAEGLAQDAEKGLARDAAKALSKDAAAGVAKDARDAAEGLARDAAKGASGERLEKKAAEQLEGAGLTDAAKPKERVDKKVTLESAQKAVDDARDAVRGAVEAAAGDRAARFELASGPMEGALAAGRLPHHNSGAGVREKAAEMVGVAKEVAKSASAAADSLESSRGGTTLEVVSDAAGPRGRATALRGLEHEAEDVQLPKDAVDGFARSGVARGVEKLEERKHIDITGTPLGDMRSGISAAKAGKVTSAITEIMKVVDHLQQRGADSKDQHKKTVRGSSGSSSGGGMFVIVASVAVVSLVLTGCSLVRHAGRAGLKGQPVLVDATDEDDGLLTVSGRSWIASARELVFSSRRAAPAELSRL